VLVGGWLVLFDDDDIDDDLVGSRVRNDCSHTTRLFRPPFLFIPFG